MQSIFKEIVNIMQNDYAGWKDKEGEDRPEYFLRLIKENNQLSKKQFKKIVDEYLLDFNDHHIHFIMENAKNEQTKNYGFKVRRYEDRLYITEVSSEKRLRPGLSFISLGGMSILELKEIHHRRLNENHSEREDWTSILQLYSYGEVEDVEDNWEIQFKLYDKQPYVPLYSVEKRQDIAFITMTDFFDPDSITKMVEYNKETLESTDKWIIDVRVNYGGSDSSFYSLLPYLISEEGIEISDSEDKMLMNCTEASTKRILPVLEKAIAETGDSHGREMLEIFKHEWELNRGKGFVEFNIGEKDADTFLKGSKHPSRIVVLTDVMCGSAGDSFVELVKKLHKVTILGRATMGLNDYSNLVSMKWKQGFELMYPSSRLARIDKGEGMTGVGITPHVHIPWSPDHIDVDIDVKKAFEILF